MVSVVPIFGFLEITAVLRTERKHFRFGQTGKWGKSTRVEDGVFHKIGNSGLCAVFLDGENPCHVSAGHNLRREIVVLKPVPEQVQIRRVNLRVGGLPDWRVPLVNDENNFPPFILDAVQQAVPKGFTLVKIRIGCQQLLAHAFLNDCT